MKFNGTNPCTCTWKVLGICDEDCDKGKEGASIEDTHGTIHIIMQYVGVCNEKININGNIVSVVMSGVRSNPFFLIRLWSRVRCTATEDRRILRNCGLHIIR